MQETIPEKVKLEREKTGTRTKIFILNKLLTIILVLLAQVKEANNSSKLKNEITQILYLLYQHSKITKTLYNLTTSL